MRSNLLNKQLTVQTLTFAYRKILFEKTTVFSTFKTIERN